MSSLDAELLQRVEVPVSGALILRGVCMTKGWLAGPRPLAAGLRALDGSTTYQSRGYAPLGVQLCLPVPVRLGHGGEAVGSVFELSGTRSRLFFRAWVAPPGTSGFDDEALRHVWEGVAGDLECVSLLASEPSPDGRWTPKELALLPEGQAANPACTIVAVQWPDGTRRTRPELFPAPAQFTEAEAQYRSARWDLK